MILVTGATGKVGTDLVKALEARGEQVRAMVRNPERATGLQGQGVEIVAGDFDKIETVDAALQGVDKVFLLSVPGPQMAEQTGAFVEAAKRADVKHIVRLSILPSSPDSPLDIGKWHGDADQHVIDSGIAYTLLRPAYFMQNQLMAASSIASEGTIYGMLGDGKVGHIDTRDVSDVAASVLTTEGHEGMIYPLTGSESLSMPEVAGKISAAIGREVKYVNVPSDAVRQGMLGMGAPEFLADAMVQLYTMVSEGKADMVMDSVSNIAGHEPISFDQFARDFASAFTA